MNRSQLMCNDIPACHFIELAPSSTSVNSQGVEVCIHRGWRPTNDGIAYILCANEWILMAVSYWWHHQQPTLSSRLFSRASTCGKFATIPYTQTRDNDPTTATQNSDHCTYEYRQQSGTTKRTHLNIVTNRIINGTCRFVSTSLIHSANSWWFIVYYNYSDITHYS